MTLVDELCEIFEGKCLKCGDCCRANNGCFARKGYFTELDGERFEAVKDRFDASGFLGADGCRLSRYERSFTCVTHLCPNAVRKIPQIERNLFAVLVKELKDFEQGG